MAAGGFTKFLARYCSQMVEKESIVVALLALLRLIFNGTALRRSGTASAAPTSASGDSRPGGASGSGFARSRRSPAPSCGPTLGSRTSQQPAKRGIRF